MITLTNQQDLLEIAEQQVVAVVEAVFRHEEAGEPNLSVAVVDDATIQRINNEHLGHDHPTDSLAFDYKDDPGPDGICGEVVVSAETACREAAVRGIEPLHELLLYVAHGVLHLLGHEDGTPSLRLAMNRRAGDILLGLGVVSDP